MTAPWGAVGGRTDQAGLGEKGFTADSQTECVRARDRATASSI